MLAVFHLLMTNPADNFQTTCHSKRLGTLHAFLHFIAKTFEKMDLLTATNFKKLEKCFDCSVNELLKVKEELTRERDETLQEVAKLREKIAETQDREQKLEKDLDDAQSKMQEV